MEIKAKVAIIGAGTAGLSAFKEVSKYCKDVVLIDPNPLGTTCAHHGCMPSKVLIHVANQYYQRRYFSQLGIQNGDQLRVDLSAVLKHVRDMRDSFTKGVLKFIHSLGDQFIQAQAQFIDQNTLQVGKNIIRAEKVIIATGSTSFVPEKWQEYKSQILTAENIFEQETLSNKINVIGAGVVGLELGQSLARLGIEIAMFHSGELIGGLSDPVVNQYALECFGNEFALYIKENASIERKNQKLLTVSTKSTSSDSQQIVAAIGRKPNLNSLNLECLQIKLNQHGIPKYDSTTMQIEDLPIFIAGDANTIRPLLHEAADEGRIAGFNTTQTKIQCFVRRVSIKIIFCDPNIVVVGEQYKDLQEDNIIIGETSFDDQGRAKIMNKNRGYIRIYADQETGVLRGSEFILPAGEHIAHLLAFAIQNKMTVIDLLQMPYYHPVIEEGIRTALRSMIDKIKTKSTQFELAMCDSGAVTL